MSQGLAQSAVNGVLSNKVHPLTGEPIVPIGFLPSGKAVWPIMGGAPDDDEGDDDADDQDDDDDADDADDADDQDDDDSDDSKKSIKDRKLARENARKRKENDRLRKTVEEQAARLKEIEDKDKGDAEKLAESNTELTDRATKAEERAAKLTLENAFLADNTHQWRNPKAALRLVDLSEVEIDDEGNVEGLDEALDALAKSDPYLLKGKDDDDEDEPPTKRSSGQPPKTKKTKGVTDRDKLLAKYPALRRG